MSNYKWLRKRAKAVTRWDDGKSVKNYMIRIPMELWREIECRARYEGVLRSKIVMGALQKGME